MFMTLFDIFLCSALLFTINTFKFLKVSLYSNVIRIIINILGMVLWKYESLLNIWIKAEIA